MSQQRSWSDILFKVILVMSLVWLAYELWLIKGRLSTLEQSKPAMYLVEPDKNKKPKLLKEIK